MNTKRLHQRLTAGIKLQSALALARDLQAERDGDKAVFTRMVDHHGKQIVTPAIAIKNINRLMSEAREQYPVTCRWLTRWMENNINEQPPQIIKSDYVDKFKIIIDDKEYIAACMKFARTRAGIPDYADSGQTNVSKRYDDELTCKVGEMAIKIFLNRCGIDTTEPDLNIYESKDKRHGPDLVCSDGTEIHAKATNEKWPWRKTWTFQYGGQRRDPIIDGNCRGYFFGCGVSKEDGIFVVKILCIIPANTVKYHLSDPDKKELIGDKKVVRLSDLSQPYDFPVSWR